MLTELTFYGISPLLQPNNIFTNIIDERTNINRFLKFLSLLSNYLSSVPFIFLSIYLTLSATPRFCLSLYFIYLQLSIYPCTLSILRSFYLSTYLSSIIHLIVHSFISHSFYGFSTSIVPSFYLLILFLFFHTLPNVVN